MSIDFLSILNETNSIKNEETGEIIITTPELEITDKYTINSKCKITSNCNTIIKSSGFNISSNFIFLSNITFKTFIYIKNSFNVNIINCNIKDVKDSFAISINNSKSIFLDQITITNVELPIGIFIYNKSHLIASKILINGLIDVNISCKDESKIYIDDSTFYQSNSNGININNSYSEIENCKISNTVLPGIFAFKSKGIIENNEITNIKMNGIVIHDESSFEIKDNKITNINGSAISVIENSTCNIHHNIISEINNNGIYVDKKSNVTAYNNELNNIKCPAIAIINQSKANVFENEITKINTCGIRIIGSKNVEINRNKFQNINECAISILDSKVCFVTNNNISDCKIAAIEVYNNSIANLINNSISNINEYAFLSYISGQIKAENNTISNVKKAMVNLNFNGSGSFINNKLINCPCQKEGKTGSQYFFNGNSNFEGVTNDESKKTESIYYEEKYVENNDLCIKCKQKPRQFFLLNCAHKVYCQECAEEALKTHQKCPLCRMPIIDLNEGFKTKNELCGICLDKKVDCIVMPCGHIGYCHKCLEIWFKDNQKCPYCQIKPVEFKKIHDLENSSNLK